VLLPLLANHQMTMRKTSQ